MGKKKFEILKRLLRDESGNIVLIEAAMALPIFAALFLGVLGWSYYMTRQSILDFAVQQASRCQVMPKFNGAQLPYCGFEASSTYQTFGLTNALGIIPDQTSFALLPNASPYFDMVSLGGGATYKMTCTTVEAGNPLSFLATVLLPQTHRRSACRPIQQQ